MMTAKEYVEGKVKSYTRLAERCRREAEASDGHCCPGRILRTGKRL